MYAIQYMALAFATLASLILAEDVLFPHMYGLKYTEYEQAMKLGLTAHVCKDEAEWYSMTTADFAKYKAIIIPDCICNSSLSTIKFLDDTKKVWSPAVTGNMVLIGTDPSYHAKYYSLPGAFAMMQDAISLVATGKNGTGMYFSLSCYYQSNAKPMAVQSLSEIGNFQVRGNLSHPCLNNAHLVAKPSAMTSLNDEMASNWNCSVHEVFSEYPREGSGGFEALAIALNATGLGQRSFADGTSGIPYIIARGATPIGCGNNITEAAYNEECDDGAANGTPGELCSSSCKCLFGMITPGLCRSNTTSSSSSSTQSSIFFSNSSTAAPTASLWTNSSSTILATASSNISSTAFYSNSSSLQASPQTSLPSEATPVTVTVYPSGPPTSAPASSQTTAESESQHTLLSSALSQGSFPPLPPPVVTVTAEPSGIRQSPPGTVTVLPPTLPSPASASNSVDASHSPGSTTESQEASAPGVITVTASGQPGALLSSPTAILKSRSSDGSPAETVTAAASSQPSASLKSQSDVTPVTVTATADPSGQAPPNSESQAGISLGTETGQPAITPGSLSITLTDSSSQMADSVTPAGQSTLSSGQAGASIGSTAMAHSSPPETTSEQEPAAPPKTVTVLPPRESASTMAEQSTCPEDVSTRAATDEPPIQSAQPDIASTAPWLPPSSGGELASPTGPASTLSGRLSTLYGPPVGSQLESTAVEVTTTVSGIPSKSTAGDPLDSSAASQKPSDSRTTSSTHVATPFTVPLKPSSSPGVSQDAVNASTGLATQPTMTSTGPSGPLTHPQPGTSTGRFGAETPSDSFAGVPTMSGGANSGVASGSPSAVVASGAPTKETSNPVVRSRSQAQPDSSSSRAVAEALGPSSGLPQPSAISGISPGFPSGTGSHGSSGTSGPKASESVSANQATPPYTSRQGWGNNTMTTTRSAMAELTTLSPPSSSHCDAWIGIEVIYMVEITEICPEGSTSTTTITECVATMTRSICQTSASSYPCYPCILGTSPSPDHTVTVTMTSCSTSTEPTVTITVQHCSTCATTTYTGTVPGYTPGTSCYGCSPYASRSLSSSLPLSKLTPTDAAGTIAAPPDPQGPAYHGHTGFPAPPDSPGFPGTTTGEPHYTTSAGLRRSSVVLEHSSGAESSPQGAETQAPSAKSVAPGNPQAPDSPQGYGQPPPPAGGNSANPHPPSSRELPAPLPPTVGPAPTHTPYRPTTAPPAPAAITAGGSRNAFRHVGAGLIGCLVLLV